MLKLSSGRRGPLSRWEDEYDDWRGRRTGPSSTLLLAGLVVVGLGVVTWHYLGPDLVRYMKIKSM